MLFLLKRPYSVILRTTAWGIKRRFQGWHVYFLTVQYSDLPEVFADLHHQFILSASFSEPILTIGEFYTHYNTH